MTWADSPPATNSPPQMPALSFPEEPAGKEHWEPQGAPLYTGVIPEQTVLGSWVIGELV